MPLPPEAERELKRLRRREAARLAAANAIMATLVYRLLHPRDEPPRDEEAELRKYLSQ